MPEETNQTDLKEENERLKQKVKEYEALQEDMMAQRVFEKTRKLLTVYITVGGFLLLVAGVVGVMQIVDYAKNHAKESIEKIVENESKKALSDETEKQKKSLLEATEKMRKEYAELGHAKEAEFEKISGEQITRFRMVSLPIGTSRSVEGGTTVPGRLDYASEMGPIRDVGTEGSVVGFAMADALEYQIKKTMEKRVTISPRYIYYKTRELEGTVDSDAGATLLDAVKVVSQVGAVAEETWPYRPGEFRAKPPNDVEKAAHYKITRARPVRNSAEMKAALAQFGPAVAGFPMYASEQTQAVVDSGVIPMPAGNEQLLGGHAACFVGFDDGKKLLKFRNSWGSSWGDKGHGYLSYEYFDKMNVDAWSISMEPANRP
jgi:C1A family cysteine protease